MPQTQMALDDYSVEAKKILNQLQNKYPDILFKLQAEINAEMINDSGELKRNLDSWRIEPIYSHHEACLKCANSYVAASKLLLDQVEKLFLQFNHPKSEQGNRNLFAHNVQACLLKIRQHYDDLSKLKSVDAEKLKAFLNLLSGELVDLIETNILGRQPFVFAGICKNEDDFATLGERIVKHLVQAETIINSERVRQGVVSIVRIDLNKKVKQQQQRRDSKPLADMSLSQGPSPRKHEKESAQQPDSAPVSSPSLQLQKSLCVVAVERPLDKKSLSAKQAQDVYLIKSKKNDDFLNNRELPAWFFNLSPWVQRYWFCKIKCYFEKKGAILNFNLSALHANMPFLRNSYWHELYHYKNGRFIPFYQPMLRVGIMVPYGFEWKSGLEGASFKSKEEATEATQVAMAKDNAEQAIAAFQQQRAKEEKKVSSLFYASLIDDKLWTTKIWEGSTKREQKMAELKARAMKQVKIKPVSSVNYPLHSGVIHMLGAPARHNPCKTVETLPEEVKSYLEKTFELTVTKFNKDGYDQYKFQPPTEWYIAENKIKHDCVESYNRADQLSSALNMFLHLSYFYEPGTEQIQHIVCLELLIRNWMSIGTVYGCKSDKDRAGVQSMLNRSYVTVKALTDRDPNAFDARHSADKPEAKYHREMLIFVHALFFATGHDAAVAEANSNGAMGIKNLRPGDTLGLKPHLLSSDMRAAIGSVYQRIAEHDPRFSHLKTTDIFTLHGQNSKLNRIKKIKPNRKKKDIDGKSPRMNQKSSRISTSYENSIFTFFSDSPPRDYNYGHNDDTAPIMSERRRSRTYNAPG